MPARRNIDWSQVEDLGHVHDREVAQRLGVSREAVSKARRARGVPAFKQPRERTALRFPIERLEELGKLVRQGVSRLERMGFTWERADAHQQAYLYVLDAWTRLQAEPDSWQAYCRVVIHRRLQNWYSMRRREVLLDHESD